MTKYPIINIIMVDGGIVPLFGSKAVGYTLDRFPLYHSATQRHKRQSTMHAHTGSQGDLERPNNSSFTVKVKTKPISTVHSTPPIFKTIATIATFKTKRAAQDTDVHQQGLYKNDSNNLSSTSCSWVMPKFYSGT